MIGRCDHCGTETVRYGGPDVMNAACETCGRFIFWCLHWGINKMGLYDPSRTEWVKIDLRDSSKVLDQMIDSEFQEGEWRP